MTFIILVYSQEVNLFLRKITLGTILLVLLILFLLSGLPVWPHSRSWGYRPVGIIGTILVIYLVLVLLGRISIGF
ncbi:MAG: DUF3309 family protein [Legionella sp.]|nr:DUF3309 family protein [Legionella sp.]